MQLDIPTLMNLVESTDMAFVQELIEAFVEDGQEQIAVMRSSLESGDAAAFQRAAHSLKASSGSLGALEFSAAAKQLESMAKEGDLGAAPEHVQRIAEVFPAVEQALREFGRGS